MKYLPQLLVIVTLSCLSNVSMSAEKKVNGYIVHYNAFASDFLSPEIANAYKITRSRDIALVNITVLREDENGKRTPVDASIKATAANLTGKYKALTLRRIADGDAIYHIAELKIIDRETINFSIVAHDSDKKITTIEFTQQFFK